MDVNGLMIFPASKSMSFLKPSASFSATSLSHGLDILDIESMRRGERRNGNAKEDTMHMFASGMSVP